MAKKRFTITKKDAGTRLDIFLTEKFEDFSRSWIQKLIKQEKVKLNGERAKPSQKLKAGDKVSGSFDLPPEVSLEPDASLNKKIKIVFENEDFLVINKPTGTVVHPSVSTPSGTLVNWLLWKYPEVKSVGEPSTGTSSRDSAPRGSGQENLRPGIVHRLDKDTSGLMVVAKNQKTFDWLKKSFKGRKVKKRYYALVHGTFKKDEGTIDYPIGRSRSNPTKQVAYKSKTKIPQKARRAKTKWAVTKRFADFTLLEVTPVTGRMHQIRVHAKAIGHPVAKDEKYKSKNMRGPKNLGRMFLHAFALSFASPRGEKFSFSIPLPKELEKVLKNLPFMVQ